MKKYTSLIFAFFIVITANLYSQFSGGTGTANNPYRITSRADMEALADSIDNAENWSQGKYFKLMNDIEDSVRTVVGVIRTAVYEDNARDRTFQGNFNGNNKKITLALNGKQKFWNGNWATITANYIGLFVGIYKADVYDLTIDGYIKGGGGVGGICGVVYSGNISNCQNKCDITAAPGRYGGNGCNAGGIYGESLKRFDDAITILNCTNYGDIYSENSSAGGIGGNNINLRGSFVISSCINYGKIYVANHVLINGKNCSDAGGILGCVAGIDSLVNCINHGAINANWGCVGGIVGRFAGQEATVNCLSGCTNYGNINGSRWVGGICGGFSGIDNNRFGTVFNCINHGDITGSDIYAGGITGIAGHTIIMYNCKNTGNIKGYKAVGGISGCLFYGNTTEHFSYSHLVNSGNVSGTQGVGGISGHLHYGDTLSYCLNIGTVQGDSIVGGIIGGVDEDDLWHDSTGFIHSCHNAGLVIGKNIVGGIQGRCWGEIYTSLNTGVVIGNTNTGGIAGETNNTAIIRNCHYDKQMCIHGGIAGNDIAGQAEGYLTKELIGNNLQAKLGSADWTFDNANLYPTLKHFENDSIAFVASSPVYLYDSDVADFDRQNRVSTDFKVNLENDVKWNRIVGNVDIVNDDGLVRNSGNDTLVARIENYKKLVPINIELQPIGDVKFTIWATEHKQISPSETNYSIPIYIKANAKTLRTVTIKKLIIEIDKNIFYAKHSDNGTLAGKNQNEITIENITIPKLNAGEEVVLFNLIGDVLLGTIDSSEIIINPNVEFAEELNTEPELKNGYLTLNICHEGNDRFVENAGISPSITIKNNVVNDILEVECNVVGNGKYTLEVVDMAGRSVKVEEFVAGGAGAFLFEIDVVGFGVGRYMVVMVAPSGRRYSGSWVKG